MSGNWTQEARKVASDGAEFDLFGGGVSISGDTAIVGAPFADVGENTDQGAAYIFTRSGTVWKETQKLIASDGAAGDGFGSSVAVSGDKIVVGAQRSDASISSPLTSGKAAGFVPTATDQGAAYFFINEPFAPTAAGILISGRVLTANGAAIPNALIGMTNKNGETVSVRTNNFGHYRFEGIEAGQTLVVIVAAKGYTFMPQVIQANNDIKGLNIIALP